MLGKVDELSASSFSQMPKSNEQLDHVAEMTSSPETKKEKKNMMRTGISNNSLQNNLSPDR